VCKGGLIDAMCRVLLVIESGADTTQSWYYSRHSSADFQIDLWNRHLTNNELWLFSHEIKDLGCKLLFVICRLYFYFVSSILLIHMDVLHKPFLP
jgi:hypothetical protein